MEVQLAADQERHLLALGSEMGKSVDELVQEAVLTFIEDCEDRRDAVAALAEGGPRFSQEEMEREFGLENRIPERGEKTA
jgi:predicted DNA-binding protein